MPFGLPEDPLAVNLQGQRAKPQGQASRQGVSFAQVAGYAALVTIEWQGLNALP